VIDSYRLTEKLIIEYLTTSTNEYGGTDETWEAVATIGASIVNQKGSLRFDKQVASGEYFDSISFYCRYIRDIDKKAYRVLYNNEPYKIINVTTVQRNQNTVLECVATV
jgi:head-tail adaptor